MSRNSARRGADSRSTRVAEAVMALRRSGALGDPEALLDDGHDQRKVDQRHRLIVVEMDVELLLEREHDGQVLKRVPRRHRVGRGVRPDVGRVQAENLGKDGPDPCVDVLSGHAPAFSSMTWNQSGYAGTP